MMQERSVKGLSKVTSIQPYRNFTNHLPNTTSQNSVLNSRCKLSSFLMQFSNENSLDESYQASRHRGPSDNHSRSTHRNKRGGDEENFGKSHRSGKDSQGKSGRKQYQAQSSAAGRSRQNYETQSNKFQSQVMQQQQQPRDQFSRNESYFMPNQLQQQQNMHDQSKNSNLGAIDPNMIAQLIQNTQIQGNGQQNATSVSKEIPKFQADLTVPQIKKIEDVKQKKAPEAIRFGDIISLYVNEQIFLRQKAKKKNVFADNEGKDENEEEQGHQLFEKPDIDYKGILMSDGTTNRQFSIVPRSTEFEVNGSSLFKKCLFRVEVAQECLFSEQVQILEEKLAAKRNLKAESNVREDQILSKEVIQLNQEIAALEFDLKEKKKSLVEEQKNNDFEFKVNIGKKVTFGQNIMLRHHFSEEYLTLMSKHNAQEHGCVDMRLMNACPKGIFKFMPSTNTKKEGEVVVYQDRFKIQSSKESTEFFLHADIRKLKVQDDEAYENMTEEEQNQAKLEQLLEVNAGNEASKLKAKCFLDYNHMLVEKESLQTSDVIQLCHKESNSTLTISPKNIDFILPDIPNFLKREIKQLGAGKHIPQLLLEIDADKEERQRIEHMEERARRNKQFIFLEKEEKRLSFTNSLWEIQRLKPFKGGKVQWNNVYRLRHVGTGYYLAVDADKVEMCLKPKADQIDTLFVFRREIYPYDTKIQDTALKNMNGVYIESFYKTFLQCSLKKSQEKPKSEFHYELPKHVNSHQMTEQQTKTSQLNCVFSYYNKIDRPKMLFQLQEVEQGRAKIAYEASSMFQQLYGFYEQLNEWGLDKPKDENGEEEDDEHVYYIAPEEEDFMDNFLRIMSEEIKQVLFNLQSIILKAQEESLDNLFSLQKNLSQQGILDMLVKVIELIFYKTVDKKQRERALKGEIEKKDHFVEGEAVWLDIARVHLDSIQKFLLRILLLLCKNNRENCELLTKYNDLLYSQMYRFQYSAARLFKEIYKRSKYVFGDKSSLFTHEEGLDLKAAEQAGQGLVQANLENHIIGWISKLETIRYVKESYMVDGQFTVKQGENISSQILYLKIISMFCVDTNGRAIPHYQQQAMEALISKTEGTRYMPVVFKMTKDGKVHLFFNRKSDSISLEKFLIENKILDNFNKEIEGGADFDSERPIDIIELSEKEFDTMPYIDYVQAVLELYAAICLDRNSKAKDILASTYPGPNLSITLIKTCLEKEKLHKKLKAAFIQLARNMCIDMEYYTTLRGPQNRCYFWYDLLGEKAEKSLAERKKEKMKKEQEEEEVFEEVNFLAVTQSNWTKSNPLQPVESEQQKMKLHQKQIIEYFRKPIMDFLSLKMVSHLTLELKSQKLNKADLTPWLKLITNYIRAATSIIENGHANPEFIQAMITISAQVFIPENEKFQKGIYQLLDHDDDDEQDVDAELLAEQKLNSTYMIAFAISRAHRLKNCTSLLQKLQKTVLVLLQMIQKHRLNLQVLQFCISFATIISKESLPYVQQTEETFDLTFYKLFLVHQFDITRKISSDRLKRFAQSNVPQIRKQQEERIDEMLEELVLKHNIRIREPHQDQSDSVRKEQEEENLRLKNVKSLANLSVPLDQYLLYLVFSKQAKREVRDSAVEVLISNFNQRTSLLQEISKVELLISESDITEYREIQVQHERMVKLIFEVVKRDLSHLLSGQKEQTQYERTVRDITDLLQGQVQNMKMCSESRLTKRQGIMRHFAVHDLLIDEFSKKINYSDKNHFILFKQIINYLFMFIYQNKTNQKEMSKHLNYLLTLVTRNVKAPKLIGQILIQQKESELGKKFLEHLIDQMNENKELYQSSIMNLLVVLAQGSEHNSNYILKRLIKKPRFAKRLYLDDDKASQKKNELVIELIKKKQFLNNTHAVLKNVLEDQERIDLHLACVLLLATCANSSHFCIEQARQIVKQEPIFNALLSEAIPYKMKRYYFRLFHEVYLNNDLDAQSIDVITFDDPQLLDLFEYIVVDDLKLYFQKYPGLAKKSKNQIDSLESQSEKIKQELITMTQEREALYKKQEGPRQIEERKAKKQGLSNITHSKALPFIDENDMGEYWRYLYSFRRAEAKEDGLLLFIQDFYKQLKKLNRQSRQKEGYTFRKSPWTQQLVTITEKIRDIIGEMLMKLEPFRTTYKNELIDLQHFGNILLDTFYEIPIINIQKIEDKAKKDAIEKQEHLDTLEGFIIGDKLHVPYDPEENQKVELDDSAELDVNQALKNVIKHVTDYIISEKVGIREAFGLEQIQTELYISKKELLRKLRLICVEMVPESIDNAVNFIQQKARESAFSRNLRQAELGQDNCIKARVTQEEIESMEHVNFMEVEALIHAEFKKQRAKVPALKRNIEEIKKAEKDQDKLKFKKENEELSRASKQDYTKYLEAFVMFSEKVKEADELFDLADKISAIVFRGLQMHSPEIPAKFINHLVDGFKRGHSKVYMLKIFNTLFDQGRNFIKRAETQQKLAQSLKKSQKLKIEKIGVQRNDKKDHYTIEEVKKYFSQLQLIMHENGITQICLDLISGQNPQDLSHQAIKLLLNLLSGSNKRVKMDLLEIMKQKQNNFLFFSYLKSRIKVSTQRLIDQIKDQTVGLQDRKESREFGIHTQAVYPTEKVDLEYSIHQMNTKPDQDELKMILQLLQALCDDCFQGFQNYLRDQEIIIEESQKKQLDSGAGNKKILEVTSIDLVQEVAFSLIQIQQEVGDRIFSTFITYETIPQIFETLLDFLYGPCLQNQLLLGKWHKLYKVIDYFMSQDCGHYMAITPQNKTKLKIMHLCTQLLIAITDTENLETKNELLEVMKAQVRGKNLLNKMRDIYVFKIGGNARAEKIFYQNKTCEHYLRNSLLSVNQCSKDEFCEQNHLIKFDKLVIDTGFNIFMLLIELKRAFPEDKQLLELDLTSKSLTIQALQGKIFSQKVLKQVSKVSFDDMYNFVMIDAQKEDLSQQQRNEIAEKQIQHNTLFDPQARALKKKGKDNKSKKAKDNEKLNKGIDDVDDKDEKDQIKEEELKKHKIEEDQDDILLNEDRKILPEEDPLKQLQDQDLEAQKQKLLKKKKMQQRKCCSSCRECCQKVPLDANFIEKVFYAVFQCRWRQQKVHFSQNVVARYREKTLLYMNQGLSKEDITRLNQEKEKMNTEEEDQSKVGIFKQGPRTIDEAIKEVKKLAFKESFRFYMSNISSIEIDFKGVLTRVTFKIPTFCTYLTRKTQETLIWDINRDSQQEKLEDFFHQITRIGAELKHQQALDRRSNLLKLVADKYQLFGRITFSLVILINIIFISSYQLDNNGDLTYTSSASSAIEIFSLIQAILAFVVCLAYFELYQGLFLTKLKEKGKGKVKNEITKIRGSLGYAASIEAQKSSHDFSILKQEEEEGKQQQSVSEGVLLYFKAMKIDREHTVNFIYFVLSVIAVFRPWMYPILLLDIMNKIQILKNVIDAIWLNRFQLLATAMLLLVVLYIYSYFGFLAFSNSYENPSQFTSDELEAHLYCNDLWDCFLSTVQHGIRSGGGLGDVLRKMEKGETDYWARYIFDLTFFLVVIILLLNLVFGIIIDAFADMRDKNKAQLEDIENRCFICGIQRTEFELANKNWYEHIGSEHNVYAYLYFLLYVIEKPKEKCTGLEKYVKERVKEDDISFFPINRSIALEEKQNGKQ